MSLKLTVEFAQCRCHADNGRVAERVRRNDEAPHPSCERIVEEAVSNSSAQCRPWRMEVLLQSTLEALVGIAAAMSTSATNPGNMQPRNNGIPRSGDHRMRTRSRNVDEWPEPKLLRTLTCMCVKR